MVADIDIGVMSFDVVLPGDDIADEVQFTECP
jgi:hypothetical protein